MESFDSLLTCCICLDRFRNPKLLPCQHTFCMEPCMEGLIDYVKRQVKCPECRAEHRIPYKGIQEFPSNVTMQRFLEMYQTISGELPDPNQGQVMERCAICNEKEYVQPCAHCEKKVCQDCKSAHVDVLKREVARINSQISRSLHKLHDALSQVDKNAGTVRQNCMAVHVEVENLGQRLIKAIRDRTEELKGEVDAHMMAEVRNLSTLKANLEQEIANIESNSELAERHMGEQIEWDDCELMDAKEIFLKTVEFIRNFEHDIPASGDYRRPVRFSAAPDPHSLSRTLEQFGELNITKNQLQDGSNGNSNGGFPALTHSSSSAGPGLMRSKSDHRLVSALRQQEERGYGRDESGRASPVSTRRRFGDRGRRDSEIGLLGDDSGVSYDAPCERRHKYRSRFTRRNLDLDDDLESYRPEPSMSTSRGDDSAGIRAEKKERERVLDTEDASKGPLSGITRIADVPRIIQKLADSERTPKKRPEPSSPPAKTTSAQPTPAQPVPWRRQRSEEDEISKIKKQNKEADARCSRGGAAVAAAASVPKEPVPAQSARADSVSRTSTERRSSQSSTPTSALQRPRPSREESGSETEDSARRRPSRVSRPSAGAPISEGADEPRASSRFTSAASASGGSPLLSPQRKVSEPVRGEPPRVPAGMSRSSSNGSLSRDTAEERHRPAARATWERRISRSNSSESTSSESSTSAAGPKTTGAAFSTSEIKNRFMQNTRPSALPEPPRISSRFSTMGGSQAQAAGSGTLSSRPPASGSTSADTSSAIPSRRRFQSRFLGRAGTPKATASKESTSSSGSSESESESSDSESSDEAASSSFRGRATSNMAKTSIGPLLARSAQARSSTAGGEPSPTSPSSSAAMRVAVRAATLGGYGSRRESTGDYTPTSAAAVTPAPTASPSGTDRYTSRYGSSVTDGAEPKSYESRYSSSRYGSSDYSPATNGLTRSRTSSHLDTRSSALEPDSYSSYTSKYSRPTRTSTYDDYTPRYSSYSSRFLNQSESCAAQDEPEAAAAVVAETAAAAAAEVADSAASAAVAAAAAAHVSCPGPAAAVAGGSRTNGTSRYAPASSSSGSSSSDEEEDEHECERRPGRARSTSSSEETDRRGNGGGLARNPSSEFPPRPSVSQRHKMATDGGSGTDDGGAANGQVAKDMPSSAANAGSKAEALTNWAQYLKNKYGYTSKDSKAKSSGGDVTRSKSSHLLRLLPGEQRQQQQQEAAQVAPPSPSAAVPLGCPARHHYLQKSRLKFKLGSRGGGPGQLTWPRGIAVGPDNAIVVADSSNHRVQVFDQAGAFVKEFGQYGNGEAEFDCLAGVSVNRIGQFIISDRYNHRIQIFDPSGRFLRAFGQNGMMEGRFNYPWGISTDALGFIYCCDKENHRVQVFQSDGTFVGAFGSEGCSSGQLAHPHYIAVSSTNRVVVTDSNNHRVQVFDVNGKCLMTFGGEGADDGKFKFPRGVAVDDQGYIIVGDSGNHRIQIFSPDGLFLKAFGCWGSQDGEFKGLEGVAVTSHGSILVCDRENHRVQVF